METQMSSPMSKLSVSGSNPKRLESNVYPFRIEESAMCHKYLINVEKIVKGKNGIDAKHPIKTSGAEALRLIRSRVCRAAVKVISRFDRFVNFVVMYEGFDVVYSNFALYEASRTEIIPVSSLEISDEDRRIVLRDATSVHVTIKPDGGLNIQSSVQLCDREDPNIVNFFSALVKAAAPEDRFICFKGGKLIDLRSLKSIECGMERAKGVKIGTKLIGKESLSVAIDIDSKTGTFFKPQKLTDAALEYFKCRTEQNLARFFNEPHNMKRLERFVRDITVRVEDTDKAITLGGLKWEDDGNEDRRLSKNEHGMVLAIEDYTTQNGRIDHNCYPLDKLYILPHTRVSQPKQDGAGVQKPPILKPDNRYRLINEARRDIRIDHQNEYLKGFRIEIAPKPIYPVYEILPPPVIAARANNQRKNLVVDPIKRDYNSNPHQFVNSAQINRFVVYFDKREHFLNDEKTAIRICIAIKEVCMVKGMNLGREQFFGVDPGGERLEGLEPILAELDKERRGNAQNGVVPNVFVVCVGFEKDLDHDALKYLEYKYKILTQHVMGRTMARVLKDSPGRFKTDKTLNNIVKKINEKCGGTNLFVQGPEQCAALFPTGNAERNKEPGPASLIIGMDVCHGEPLTKYQELRGFNPDPSIIGIASNAQTRNDQMYSGDYIATQGRKEAVPVAVMRDHGAFLVKEFQKNHGRLPENIVLVRDGVSRSQYDMARGEFDALMEGANGAVNSPEFKPRQLLIIVTKEHNMRLFDRQGSIVVNPRAGTVVDSDIVSPFHPEFLIVPHNAFSGTAKVLLVTVLKDGDKDLRKYTGEDLNEIKHFIHTLCYLHGVSDNPQGLPEPVSMGHDLAERGSNLVKEERRRSQDGWKTVEAWNGWLRTRGTPFQGVKFTA